DGCEEWHRDAPEDLPFAAAVSAGGFEDVSWDRSEPRPDHNHRESGPDPDVGEDQRWGNKFGSEPGHAAERLGEGFRRDRRVIRAGAEFVQREGPVVVGRGGPDLLPTRVTKGNG